MRENTDQNNSEYGHFHAVDGTTEKNNRAGKKLCLESQPSHTRQIELLTLKPSIKSRRGQVEQNKDVLGRVFGFEI